MEPIACGSYSLGDETPLPLRAQVVEERGDVERGITTQLVSRAHDRAGEKSTKVVQTECWLAFIFRRTLRDVVTFLLIPLTTPLHAVDACTAEAAMQCTEEQLSIPLVDEVENMSPVNFGLNTTDSGARMLKKGNGGCKRRALISCACTCHVLYTKYRPSKAARMGQSMRTSAA